MSDEKSAEPDPPDPAETKQEETPVETTKRRPGPPEGNANASKDPAFTKAMREAQRLARRARTRRHRAHLDNAMSIVREVGLEDSPLAETVARRVGQVEAEIEELAIIVDRTGRTKRNGDLNPAFERRLMLIGQDRQELRQLLDRLIELRQANGNSDDGPRVRSMFIVPGIVGPTCPACGEPLGVELPMACSGNPTPPPATIPRDSEAVARGARPISSPDSQNSETTEAADERPHPRSEWSDFRN